MDGVWVSTDRFIHLFILMCVDHQYVVPDTVIAAVAALADGIV